MRSYYKVPNYRRILVTEDQAAAAWVFDLTSSIRSASFIPGLGAFEDHGECRLVRKTLEALRPARVPDRPTRLEHRSKWCAGHLPEREIMTGIGPVAVRCPRCATAPAKAASGSAFRLQAHSIVGAPVKTANAQVLFDPAEEQLDLPARFVQVGDCRGGTCEIVGKENDVASAFDRQLDRLSRLGERTAPGHPLRQANDRSLTMPSPLRLSLRTSVNGFFLTRVTKRQPCASRSTQKPKS
jgi:hypothetical protein